MPLATTPPSQPKVSILPEPLRIAQFRYFWLARLTWTIGSLAMVIVIGWQVYDIARHTMGLKEAAFRLGIIGLVQFIPLFLLTLVTGWTADRLDRRWIARAAVALELVCAVALGWLASTHSTTLPALYVVAAPLGVGRASAGPALSALAPNLVPLEILPEPSPCRRSPGNRERSSDRRSAAISTPTHLTHLMPSAVSCSSLHSSASWQFRWFLAPGWRGDQTRGGKWSKGCATSATTDSCWAPSASTCLRSFSGGATAMLPVFARDVLHAGSEGLGHLRAAPAVGATLTAAYFSCTATKA